MKNEKPVTFACFVESHSIEKVWFVRHVTANARHMGESFTRNYRQLVFALGVVKTCCMVTKKAVSSVGQNQPNPCQRYNGFLAVDTPILVSDSNDHRWLKRYFAKYENGSVFAWNGGRTSWSSEGHATVCELAKLPERSSNEY